MPWELGLLYHAEGGFRGMVLTGLRRAHCLGSELGNPQKN